MIEVGDLFSPPSLEHDIPQDLLNRENGIGEWTDTTILMFPIESRARWPAKDALSISEYVMLDLCFQGNRYFELRRYLLTQNGFTYVQVNFFIGNTTLCSSRRVSKQHTRRPHSGIGSN
jgi:hypothetical protein